MSLEGDFAKLAQLGARLARDTVAAVMPTLESVAVDLYQKSFAQQQGPIGGPWAESPNSMFVSGELANPEVDISEKSLSIKAPPYYGRFHQGGWRVGGERVRMAVSTNIKTRKEKKKKVRIGGKDAGPARPILPTNTTAGEWDEPLRTTLDKGVRRFLGE